MKAAKNKGDMNRSVIVEPSFVQHQFDLMTPKQERVTPNAEEIEFMKQELRSKD